MKMGKSEKRLQIGQWVRESRDGSYNQVWDVASKETVALPGTRCPNCSFSLLLSCFGSAPIVLRPGHPQRHHGHPLPLPGIRRMTALQDASDAEGRLCTWRPGRSSSLQVSGPPERTTSGLPQGTHMLSAPAVCQALYQASPEVLETEGHVCTNPQVHFFWGEGLRQWFSPGPRAHSKAHSPKGPFL